MGPRAILERRALLAPPASAPALDAEKRVVRIEHGARGARSVPSFSLLRLSVPARLALAAIVTALLWLTVLWALT